ncbi:MAG: hypothetical protein ACD_52C00209G0008 [uncultured bacterium]|uniref:Type II secretion system protein n=1 Tax=Candidatus Woesebacteria bacterium RIFCSPHIGHO2_12_FULL_41_24 TaxID=1802510 RepID=A0A1F8AUB5_9BACT|nr:MAG: hypothetical protein ACD_52C00209G0008 [uncultured bacterium]OGM14345.1 MAG: hypothetical protein A2W15_02240 [Candidatus Woesebacteria bacterium RBG_16_41_13]OGM30464.1 MAG: hypothetical protein A2873_02040 [Candidatus Woesebacteria bacterium RIFCSPHIGHO2_01_FULL_42_80]OGM34216.1 MAG: hypothetical protein A3D84_04360 [Candidatus Woesebacteria bacterium RIFCSPHIGHO2_02_FULL_42_20]OGM55327.1 MAG: hypothetical protein A3E44_03535 [Candidatus Woesebacteria bacterium RIFCSPHIGHO2_12_FULL_41
MNKTYRRNGFILLEALISIVILSMIAFSILPIVGFLIRRSERSKYEGRASLVLQEGIESAYNVLISDWDGYPDGDYSVFVDMTFSPVAWELVPTTGVDENIDTVFSRSVNIKTICRNISTGINVGFAPCSPVSHEDQSTRVVESAVFWMEEGQAKEIRGSLLVANF